MSCKYTRGPHTRACKRRNSPATCTKILWRNEISVSTFIIGNGNPVRITSFRPVDCEGFPLGLVFYRQWRTSDYLMFSVKNPHTVSPGKFVIHHQIFHILCRQKRIMVFKIQYEFYCCSSEVVKLLSEVRIAIVSTYLHIFVYIF